MVLHKISYLLLDAVDPIIIIIHPIHTVIMRYRHSNVVDDARGDGGGSIGAVLNELRQVDLLISER